MSVCVCVCVCASVCVRVCVCECVCVCMCVSLQPEQALVVYEQALKKTPRDSVLAVKVGQALVKTHHYTKVSVCVCVHVCVSVR